MRGNAIMERWISSYRRELLDRICPVAEGFSATRIEEKIVIPENRPKIMLFPCRICSSPTLLAPGWGKEVIYRIGASHRWPVAVPAIIVTPAR